ncbi:MAG: protein-L-isoaspartate O-methyltransferase, partial [Bacteroidota bacterium]
MSIVDNHIHQGLRRQLKDELLRKGIKDNRVLEAIGEVPRHVFMDSAFLQFAYEDTA